MNFLYKEISLIFFIKEICGFFSIQPKEISFHKMNFLYKEIKEIFGFFSIQPKEICGFFTKKYF